MEDIKEKLFESLVKKTSMVAIAGLPLAYFAVPKKVDLKEFFVFLSDEGIAALIADNKELKNVLIVPTAQWEIHRELNRKKKEYV